MERKRFAALRTEYLRCWHWPLPTTRSLKHCASATTTLDWVDLYRIYEVIESDMGRSVILAKRWATNADIKLFKHTANSVAATGDQARHGKETSTPPVKPLTLSEARALVDTLLRAWLAHKAS